MFRLLLSFLILFAGAAALVALLPKPATHQRPPSEVASALRAEADPPSSKPVRVVYPPTSGMAASPPTDIQDAPRADPVVQPAVIAPGKATEAADASRQAGNTPPADPAALLPATAKIDINTASVGELDQIPGAGRVGRAIASRRPYRSVEDLLSKRVLRKSVYDRIKDQLAAKWDVAGAQ